MAQGSDESQSSQAHYSPNHGARKASSGNQCVARRTLVDSDFDWSDLGLFPGQPKQDIADQRPFPNYHGGTVVGLDPDQVQS